MTSGFRLFLGSTYPAHEEGLVIVKTKIGFKKGKKVYLLKRQRISINRKSFLHTNYTASSRRIHAVLHLQSPGLRSAPARPPRPRAPISAGAGAGPGASSAGAAAPGAPTATALPLLVSAALAWRGRRSTGPRPWSWWRPASTGAAGSGRSPRTRKTTTGR